MTSYAYDFMDVQKFHDLGIKGQGIKVAVMDSGIQKHEALTIAGGINTFDNSIPYDADINNSHGTMVAGVIARKDGGIAPECELYAIRIDDGVSTKNNTQWSEQIAGMDWAIENKIDVVICSFSGFIDSKERKKAFKRAHDNGVTIFCSAGNKQSGISPKIDTIGYPARYPFVITSANLTSTKKLNTSSCKGSQLNFANVGTSITSTTTDSSKEVSNAYRTSSGTSYANPATAGIFVLYKQMYPNDSREKLLERMYRNAERVYESWRTGAGIPRFPHEYKNISIRGRK